MTLTNDQQVAEEQFEAFLNSGETTFALLGFAGTGKSFMTARFIKQHVVGSKVLLATPTHKACHVMRRFLRSAGISYEDTITNLQYGRNTLVVGTTAQLLGIAPIVDDDQDATVLKFRKSSKGFIEQLRELDWIIIDEISMLSAKQFRMIEELAGEKGARILVVGDPGQLPPVNAPKIKFNRFTYKGLLRDVVRTEDGNGITELATAVRKSEPWRNVEGSAVHHVKDVAGSYISNLHEPFSPDETTWQVYIAYRNALVNQVNEEACMKLYGHSRHDVEAGEIVLSNSNLNEFRNRERVPICTNGETLIVDHFGLRGRWGRNVRMTSVQTGLSFYTEILSEKELRDPDHPYNIELRKLMAEAQELQREYKLTGDGETNSRRRTAWAKYFDHKDNTVISVSHPFAMTAHKSQGSSFGHAFVEARDVEHFDSRALYVGVTRPIENLVIG